MNKPIILFENENEGKPEENVSLMPCFIGFDGPAPVSEFFHNKISNKDDSNKLLAYFRGRELNGSILQLPENYVGECVEFPLLKSEDHSFTGNKSESEDEANVSDEHCPASSTFSQFKIWDRDVSTSIEQNKWYKGVIEWTQFASRIASTE
ncbi:ribonuclease H2 complex subunit [Schizosaccharomyces cryophilus OY26]|uniref:Ribonuclease H2 complex subunit n=1 Tax=Schizosaccharomyces cryophilus (strain OY26 / ATCC MYA-4695 / CBS 11777 / NBRC 106824 / NRRL Y48691) TaxID=653667 RepID=S9VWV2_SCHCR|nr:ribonuclease H2 complex subunit [Schizosaccharomyces cryophilus OY26]EPY50415.1 ribonuclease H2 complex subunit [Schizosaccharomyces cryophilus OY26]